jgi:hypothetical protein
MPRAFVAGLIACGLAAAADPSYAGKWKMNPAKSNFGESTMTYEAAPGGGMKVTADGQSYTFKMDGKDVATPFGSTQAWKEVNAKTWEVTEKTNGKVSMTGTVKLSDDGKTLSMTGKRIKADGSTSDDTMTMTRVSGGPGLAGKWKMKNLNASSPELLTLTLKGADGVLVDVGNGGSVCDAKTDGKDYPTKGSLMPNGWTCALTKAGQGLDVTWKKDGKPMYKTNWTASRDGKILTESGSPVGVNEKFTVVYDRQ